MAPILLNFLFCNSLISLPSLYNRVYELWHDAEMKTPLRAITIFLTALALSPRSEARAGGPSPRLLHKESGIALVLIPAGEFLMGLPESERERVRDRRHKRIIR